MDNIHYILKPWFVFNLKQWAQSQLVGCQDPSDCSETRSETSETTTATFSNASPSTSARRRGGRRRGRRGGNSVGWKFTQQFPRRRRIRRRLRRVLAERKPYNRAHENLFPSPPCQILTLNSTFLYPTLLFFLFATHLFNHVVERKARLTRFPSVDSRSLQNCSLDVDRSPPPFYILRDRSSLSRVSTPIDRNFRVPLIATVHPSAVHNKKKRKFLPKLSRN